MRNIISVSGLAESSIIFVAICTERSVLGGIKSGQLPVFMEKHIIFAVAKQPFPKRAFRKL